jgi:hypothetical protein
LRIIGIHNFDYKEKPRELLIPQIANMLSALHECKEKQDKANQQGTSKINDLKFVLWHAGVAVELECLIVGALRAVYC